MDFESVLRLGLGLCLLVALGASANALEGALSTDPSEVIDVDEETVPIDDDDVGDLRRAVTGEPEAGGDAGSRRAAAAGDGEGQVARDRGREADSAAGVSGPRRAGQPDDSLSSSAAVAAAAASESSQSSDQRSLLERLLALLERLVPLAAAMAILAVLYALRSSLPALRSDDEETDDEPELVAAPADAVSAAWYDMVRELGYGEDPSVTPRECVRAAARTDVASHVRTLTELYEATRYGGQSVTDERIRRARETLNEFRRVRAGGGDG